ncbi:MAG: hypothetical protein MK102_08950 [Fuerstiella sp.]|nr:hypothetical protein [Fuerstiella sp.]
MKLIQEVSLEYRGVTSDKVYEVDLCEVGPEQFVVNFRCGHRGSTLREGTKTPTSVSKADALRVFNELVISREKKGYGRRGSSVDEVRARDDAVLRCLASGHTATGRWSRSRAVWRCGELQLCQAESRLNDLIGSGDAMLDYCIAWALGQCGSAESVDSLRRMESTHDAPAVRRIAAVSLLEVLDGADLQDAITECIDQLPEPLRHLARNGPADDFSEELNRVVVEAGREASYVLDIVYLIDNAHVRPALLELLRTARCDPGVFDRVRHIFKAAELRRDAEVFGIVARQFEPISSKFATLGRCHDPVSELLTTEENSRQSYGRQTRKYLRKRVWRTLQRIADSKQSCDYTYLAAGVLQAFSDDDALPVRQERRCRGGLHTRSHQFDSVHFDQYAKYFVFNRILYGNSRRFASDPTGLRFRCVPPFEPGNDVPHEREEAYPELWDQHPESVLELLFRSRCEPVHQFGVKVLRDANDFSRNLDAEDLFALLKSPYDVTNCFSFELAVSRYDPDAPDFRLVCALANCACQEARDQAFEWIDADVADFFQSTGLVVALVSGPHADTRRFVRDRFRNVALPERTMQIIAGRLMVQLHEFDLKDYPVVADMVETLLLVCGPHLRQVGDEVIRELLDHVSPEVQRFAGDLVLCHETFSSHPPDDVIRRLIESDHETVREIGVRIIGQLPDHILLDSVKFLTGLTRHEAADIRIAIRPTVRRLSESSPEFGERFARRLIDALLTPGAASGVPTHTAGILREDLRDYLAHIESDVVLTLLQSRSIPAQEIGSLLLATNVSSVDLSVNEIVRLASHEIRAVRESAWKMFEDNIPGMLAESEDAVKIVDSRQEDTRLFAFTFLCENFSKAGIISPDVLIHICNSVHSDVQQLGRSMVTRMFERGHGEEYLVKLSEHPSGDMQLFAFGLLEEYFSDSSDWLLQLLPFFIAVLSRGNCGRVARVRALTLLRQEAMKDELSARAVTEILSHMPATAVIADHAGAVELLLDIQMTWPEIATPLTVKRVGGQSEV